MAKIKRKELYRTKYNFKHLTSKQQKFCDTYLINGLNATAAAREAGYSEKSCASIAINAFKSNHIKNYINNRQLKIREKQMNLGVTFDYKINKLKMIADLAMPEDAKSIKEINASATIQAIAELNKMQGDYAAEKRVNTNVNFDADSDIQKTKELVNRLIEENQKEF